MLEIINNLKRGFIYGKEFYEKLKESNLFEFIEERSEEINGFEIYSVIFYQTINLDPFSFNLCNLGNVKCKHGSKLNYLSNNRLPQEGWEELIDSWSCHNSEFKSMLDLKIKTRKDGILTSNFYLLANDTVLPDCCKATEKFFFNELIMERSNLEFIFYFFEEYFLHRSFLVLEYQNKSYEIKLFYNCILFDIELRNAMKLGVKETIRKGDISDQINAFYIELIMKTLQNNKINIKSMGYDITYLAI